MAGADTSTEDDDIAEYREEFEEAREAWSANYDAALDDFKFGRLHQHWPEKIRRQREEDGRPCLTIPLLPPILRQVVNDGRQNKPSIRVSAADSVADPKTAEIINGLIRQIERSSNADVAYDTALDHSATGGFGFLKVNTRYATDDSFEQDIVIETVADAFSIIPDPDSTAADSSDWNVAFEVENLSERVFKRRFKGADPVSFDDERKTTTRSARDKIKIVYRWSREESVRQIVALSAPNMDAPSEAVAMAMQMNLLPPNMIVDIKVYEDNKALFDALGINILGQPRDVPSYKVTQKCLSGAEVLKTTDWAGKWIPIVPIYGSDIVVEGERTLEGMVRAAKDEQRRHNFHMSSATEATALAPKTPFIGKKGQFASDADKWASANQKTWAYIEYDDPEDGSDPGPPQRQSYAGVPIGDFQMAISAADSIKAITGVHNASLGAPGNETSGRAIYARQREGDVGTFHYIDNLSRAIRHTGAILLDLIPKVYSTARIVRILGPDEQERQVKIGPKAKTLEEGEEPIDPMAEVTDAVDDIERVYDLTVGKYDLDVKAGPSFSTQREEFVALITEIIRSFPAAAPVLLDLVVKNYDIPDAEKVVARLEAMLPANLQGESPEAQQMKAQIEQLSQMLGQLKAENMGLKQDKAIEEQQTKIKGYEAETKRMGVIFGKDGGPYDPAQANSVVLGSLLQILNSPDILQMAQAGGDVNDLAQQLAQRMQPQDQEQPPVAA